MLVKEVCGYLVRILEATGAAYCDLANELLSAMANTAKPSTAAVRRPGASLFAKTTELCRYDLGVLKTVFIQNKIHGMQDSLRAWHGGNCELTFWVVLADSPRS